MNNDRFLTITKETKDSGSNDWKLLDDVTRVFNCLIIVGAGNHYDLTPTVAQIARKELNFDRFRIIRQFDGLLEAHGRPFYRQIFEMESTRENVVFYGGFPNKYIVKESFAVAFGSAIRLNLENLTANRVNSSEDGFYHNCYRDVLVSCSNS